MKENISLLVPRDEAEMAILKELTMIGGDADTGYIVSRAMERFPVLKIPKEKGRQTPSGHPWWPGRFRFDLTNLKKKGEVVGIRRGVLRITDKG